MSKNHTTTSRSKLKQIVDVWAAEDWDWVCDGCADVSYALWLIGQKLEWNCRIITGNVKVGESHFGHVWLNIDGKIFDPVAHANGYKVQKYSPMSGQEAEHLKVVKEVFGVVDDEFYGFDADDAIKEFQLT